PDPRHPELRDGHGLPQVRILKARPAPTERWIGRRRRSGAKNPGPRADVSAGSDERARTDRPEARHQEADRRQGRREFGRPERREFVVRRSLSRPSPTPFRFLPSRPNLPTPAWRLYRRMANTRDDVMASRREQVLSDPILWGVRSGSTTCHALSRLSVSLVVGTPL